MRLTLPPPPHTLVSQLDVNAVVDFGLAAGLSAETSGGLLVMLPSAEVAEAFIADLEAPAWVVGHVAPGSRQCVLADDLAIIDV